LAQEHACATFAPKISQEECIIDWMKEAEVLHNLIRSLSPHPGASAWGWIGKEKKRLKIFRSKVSPLEGHPGEMLSFQKDQWIVGCGKKSLSIEEVQPEGKRRMSLEEFYSGYRKNFSFCSPE
jgi:methionyl-tRNA formyltransferase